MKQLSRCYFLFVFGLFLTTLAYGQTCSRTGTFVGAGDVDVRGVVTLEEQSDGSIQLLFSSDFFSDPGPDLDVYLGNTDRISGSSVRLERLKSESGTQTYTLPSGISANQYLYVTVHCTQYNHYYGAAQLGAISGACQTLGTNLLDGKRTVEINVSNGKIQVVSATEASTSRVQILDLTGQVVYSNMRSISKGITWLDPKLQSGLYVVVVETTQGTVSNRVFLK